MHKSSPIIAVLLGFIVYAIGSAYLVMSKPQIPSGINVTDSFARAASPSAKAGAVFLQLVNKTEQADRLIGVRSKAAKRVELHTHKMDTNGVMSMVHIEEGLPVEKGGAIIMERGGIHIMLMGLNKSLVSGQSVDLVLIFEKAGEILVTAQVDLDR